MPATHDRKGRAPVGPALLAIAGLFSSLATEPVSAAFLADSQSIGATFAADTLSPPTGLSATGGTTVTLTWTPTVDAYAAGYYIDRAASSGGPFGQVGSTTPRTATSTTDTPSANGTYWYQLRAYASTWASVSTTAVSVAYDSGVTGFRPCTAQAFDTGGDANGYEGTAANGCSVDGAVARDVNSGSGTSTSCTSTAKDRHRFSSFGLGVPSTASAILGISVRPKVGIDLASGTNLICAQLSWDAGTTWTTTLSVAVSATALTTYTLGGTTNTWGRTWTATQLSDSNFRVRLIDVSNNNARDFSLDGVEVQVNYTP